MSNSIPSMVTKSFTANAEKWENLLLSVVIILSPQALPWQHCKFGRTCMWFGSMRIPTCTLTHLLSQATRMERLFLFVWDWRKLIGPHVFSLSSCHLIDLFMLVLETSMILKLKLSKSTTLNTTQFNKQLTGLKAIDNYHCTFRLMWMRSIPSTSLPLARVSMMAYTHMRWEESSRQHLRNQTNWNHLTALSSTTRLREVIRSKVHTISARLSETSSPRSSHLKTISDS